MSWTLDPVEGDYFKAYAFAAPATVNGKVNDRRLRDELDHGEHYSTSRLPAVGNTAVTIYVEDDGGAPSAEAEAELVAYLAAHTGEAYDSGPRVHPETRALITAIDPGTDDTDPRYRAFHFQTQAVVGVDWFDIAEGDRRLQEIIVQVKNAAIGDTIETAVRSDGTVPAYGPEGTVLRTYGAMNAPMKRDAFGWSDRIREPVKITTSADLPPGTKASIGYHSASAVSQEVLLTAITQE